MELTTGQIEGQQLINIEALKEDLRIPTHYKIFVDTIDESNDVFVEGEVLVVHVARSEYDAADDAYELVKKRVRSALAEHF